MDGQSDSDLQTTGFIVFLLILSTLGMVWTVSCSWLTGRKKRQRVGHNAEIADGLVLQINRPVSVSVTKPHSASIKSPRNKTLDRYSVTEQSLCTTSDDLRKSLQLPTILVTPPTPVDMYAEVSSLGSCGSIGKADDLVLGSEDSDANDQFGEAHYDGSSPPIGGPFYRRALVRDSMRNRISGLYSDQSSESLEGACDDDFGDGWPSGGHMLSTQDKSSTPVVTLLPSRLQQDIQPVNEEKVNSGLYKASVTPHSLLNTESPNITKTAYDVQKCS